MNYSNPDFSAELARFSIFQGMPREELQALPVIKSDPIRRGTTIFKQGDLITRLFLITKGEVELVHVDKTGGALRRVVRAGQVLGRLELDIAEGQLGTARATQAVELLWIDKATLVHLRAKYPTLRNHLDRSEVIGHLRSIPYFAPLSNLEIKWISDIITIEEAAPEQGPVHVWR